MKDILKKQIFLVVLLALYSLSIVNGNSAENSSYKIPVYLFSGGGSKLEGTSYKMRTVIIGQNMPPLQLADSEYKTNANTGYVLLRSPNNSPTIVSNQQYHMPDTDQLSYHHGVSVKELINQNSDAIDDIDINSNTGIAIVDAKNYNGKWQYSMNNGDSWINFNNLSETSAVLLSQENTRIRFTPDERYAGDDTGWLTIKAWDITEGINGQTNFDTTQSYAVSTNKGIINGGLIQLLEAAIPVFSHWGALLFYGILLLSALIMFKKTKLLNSLHYANKI